MSGVTTSSLSLAWSLRNWVILDYEVKNGLTVRPWAPFLSSRSNKLNCPWKIECFLEDLFLGGQSSVILGYRRLSVKSLLVSLSFTFIGVQRYLQPVSKERWFMFLFSKDLFFCVLIVWSLVQASSCLIISRPQSEIPLSSCWTAESKNAILLKMEKEIINL